MHQKVLSMILVLVMLLGLLSVSAFTTTNATSSGSADSTEFMRIFHLDCGRKYFSVSEIESLIDTASENNYTHVELAIGNDGLRFLLDDMSLTVNGEQYASEDVSREIHNGNEKYYNFDVDELTQPEMDEIIAHAQSKNISIIPLINTPGHMDAILSAATSLTGTNYSYSGSVRTIDVTNATAVAFTQALLQKYITYFAKKGCKYFNMGADEYANDIYTTGDMGFGQLINAKKYAKFAEYVNSIAAIIKEAKMTPMAFNDGIYYNETTTNGYEPVSFDKDIVICYWTAGYGSYSPASASFLVSKGLKIINTNDAWYYVLGRSTGSYTLSAAQRGVKNTRVTDVPGNNDPVPIGAMMCLWCDSPSAPYTTNDNEQNHVKSLIQTLADNNQTYFTKSTPTDPGTDTGDTKTEKTITISVGGTTTERLDGDYPGTLLNDKIATVTGKVADTPGKPTYKPATLGEGTFYVSTTANDTAPTVQLSFEDAGNRQYYIKNSEGKYLYPTADYFLGWDYSVTTTTKNEDAAVKVETNSDGSIVISKTATSLWLSTTAYLTLNGTSLDASGNSKSLYLYQQLPTSGGKETTLTFTGKSAGTTTVTIGNVKYTINVVDRAPDNAMIASTINLEYWITNFEVYSGKTTYTDHIKAVSSSEASSDAGIAITDIAPNHAYSFFDGTKDVYYWQAMRLDADHQQTNASGDDETANGTTLTHIRYHGGAWQYKTTDGVWRYFVSTDQLVAYYLQKTKVTQEIDTYMKDWGYDTSKTTDDTSGGYGQVALTVAVVYPDGTVSPAEGSMYSSSTVIYNFKLNQNGTWVNRDIGIIAPKNNSDYNISKITVTNGERKSNTSANVWYTRDTITWDKKTNVAGKEWYDETEVWNKSSGTTPMVNGKTSNITWSAKNTAKLVLIYLEPVEKETNLNVQYIDLNANNYVFHSYQVAMKYNQDDPKPTFNGKLMQGDAVIGGKGAWTSNVPGNTDYLPDDAYVTNSSGTQQTFRKDITTIPEINGIYASGLYKYKKADISEDGKTLRLYYDLNATGDKTFVVDFGLPVVIPFSDFGISNISNITVSFDEQNTAMTERQGAYGKGKIDMGAMTVTYTLTKTLDAQVPIPIYVTDGNGKTRMLSVNIIPATSVYYEDSFATFTDGTGKAVDATWSIVNNDDNKTEGQLTSPNQALSELGSKKVYGYDDAYTNSTKLSMSSAHKVTVKSDMYVKNDTTTTWPTATFTFKGTGFDVISLTNNKSGAISVKVYAVNSDGTETQVKGTLVNNYYGYELKDGAWTVNKNANNALYQIPVIKIDDLTYGTYKVVITAAYATYADKTGVNQYSFWLDAIRVYDPMVKDKDNYAQDGEGYPQYIKLHDALVNSTAQSQAFFIDGGSVANVETYKNFGPNNEVYLAEGQAITFKVQENTDIASIQIGAKAPSGTAAQMDVTGGTDLKQPLNTATEMYYKIGTAGGSFTITNKGKGLLSLTNLKITFKNKPASAAALIPPTAEEQKAAVMCVRALFAEPEQTFEPEHFTAKWSRNVHKGGKATLTVKTSADVEAIHVDDVTIDSYKVRTERSGWGSSAKKVTYHVFTYTVTATATADYTVCAINADGVMSDPITATLTVRPSIRDWWHNVFGKWQH